MTAIWAMLAQAIMIAIAYPSACLAGAIFATVALMNVDGTPIGEDLTAFIDVSIAVATLALRGFVDAFIASAIAIALTEGLKLRAFVTYLIIGCLVGFVMTLPLGEVLSGAALPDIRADAVQLAVAAGAIGGFVYWAIAGRTAGRWLELRWFEPNRR